MKRKKQPGKPPPTEEVKPTVPQPGEQPTTGEVKPTVGQPGKLPPEQVRKSLRLQTGARYLVVVAAIVAAFLLAQGWWAQSHAPLSCEKKFDPVAQINSYIQINILSPNQTEQDFNAEVFLYYPDNESPPASLRLTRAASGDYAPSILETQLIQWGGGHATPKQLPLDIPTPGVSLRHFPLDSRTFDFSLSFTPPQRPRFVIIRNLTTDFIPACSTFSSQWDGIDKLGVTITFRRNPFVQRTAVLVGLAALVFGLLLLRLKSPDDLARATASYFFSLWSVRGLVTPSGLAYSTLLDFWFMVVAAVVLFVVAWRFTASMSSDKT
jgi:hypothetical protein